METAKDRSSAPGDIAGEAATADLPDGRGAARRPQAGRGQQGAGRQRRFPVRTARNMDCSSKPDGIAAGAGALPRARRRCEAGKRTHGPGPRACLALLAAAALLALAAPAQAQTEVWTATLTPGDLGFSILGCSNNVGAARCSSTTVLSEDSFNYDSTDYTITLLLVRSGGNFELEVDADITTATAALTLVVGSTSLVLADADTISTRRRVWENSGITLPVGTDITVKLTAPGTTNTPPTATHNTVTTGEDRAYTFEADDFSFADTDTGDTLASVTIVTPPAAGTLALDGTAVMADDVVTEAQIDADMLTFTPARDAHGAPYTTFTFKVNDGTVDSASAYTMTCQTDFISDHGSPLMVSFAELGTVDSRTDVLPPGGSVHQETDVDLSAPLAPGWARATCTGPVQASLLFRGYNSEGMPVAEAGVNAATVPATRFVTFAEQGEGKNGTGVAYANPSDTAALVTFTVRDADGEVLAIEDLMLPPNWHGAQNMPPLFDLSSFTGSLEITSTEPIVSLSLNFEAASVFSSLPPGEPDAAAQGSTTYYFTHLAVGASYQTTITYINYSPEEVSCQTDFISDHGSPLMVSFAGRGTVISRNDVLPPGGSVHQETNVDLSGPLVRGWARVTCSGPVQASLLYRRRNSEGIPTGEAGVNATAVPATRFVTFAEQGEGRFGTGVAYTNPSPNISVPVTFTARDTAGELLASVVRTLLPGGHDAHGISELFDLSSFTGSIEVTSTEPIFSLSVNFEADPVFSSLPPGELDAAAQ